MEEKSKETSDTLGNDDSTEVEVPDTHEYTNFEAPLQHIGVEDEKFTKMDDED